MTTKLAFNDWLELKKDRIPFHKLVQKNSIVQNYIKKEWESCKTKNPQIYNLDSLDKLQMVEDFFKQVKYPVKLNEDRIDVANAISQNIITSLDKLGNTDVIDLVANYLINATKDQQTLVELAFWAKNESKASFNYNSEVEPIVADYLVMKGQVDRQIKVYLDGLNLTKIYKSEGIIIDAIWFKIGLGFAKGEIQELYSSGKSGRYISKHILGKDSAQTYITQTLNNTESPKNIYRNSKYMKSITLYCEEHNITPCKDFSDAYSNLLN